MTFVVVFAVLAIVLVIPIMLGARIVGARNTGFGSALLAVVILAAFSAAVENFVANDIVAFVVAAVIGAIVLAGVLGTTFYRGLAVSVIAAIIQAVAILVIASTMGGGAA